MSDLPPLPLVLTASDRLNRSAMPTPPSSPPGPGAVRLRASRPRLRIVQLEKE